MQAILSMLRGINVGQKKVLMSDLKALYEALGFTNITTFIQSGNVIFESNSSPDLSAAIEQKLFERYHFTVPVIIRTLTEMQNLLAHNSFLSEENIEINKLHVTFLADNPAPEMVNKIKEVDYTPDRFVIHGKEVYLYCPNGYGITKLNNSFFEKKLKVTATTRNWKTVNELFKIIVARQNLSML